MKCLSCNDICPACSARIEELERHNNELTAIAVRAIDENKALRTLAQAAVNTNSLEDMVALREYLEGLK